MQELQNLHQTLLAYDGDEFAQSRPAWMDKTCPVLVSKRILSHQHKDVRLMACCCVVEMLRVYAPEAPFSDQQLKVAFEALIIELRGLQHPERAAFEKVSGILESLAVLKSCVLVVGMAEEGNDELVTALFQVLLQSVRPEHSDQTRRYMVDVMRACLEDFEGPVPDSLIEILMEAVLNFKAEDDEDDIEDAKDAVSRAAGKGLDCILLSATISTLTISTALCRDARSGSVRDPRS